MTPVIAPIHAAETFQISIKLNIRITSFLISLYHKNRGQLLTQGGRNVQKMTLKTLRTLKNWRQSDAAAAVNVSVDTWGHWERGITEPSVSKAYQIANEL